MSTAPDSERGAGEDRARDGMPIGESWDLERFVRAQDEHDTYARAARELAVGRKRTHWMWFVFPQLAGLGRSATSQHFALSGLPEARAYLAHPVLGPRLRQSVRVLAGLEGRTAEEVLGDVDASKLRSCLTLFAEAAPHEGLFAAVLQQFFEGPDGHTLKLLRADG